MSTVHPPKLDHLLKHIREIPALPELVNRIVQRLGNPNTPAAEIAKLITFDAGLSSKVLRMVNAAAFGVPRQIASIQHAVMLLGFNTTRSLVLSASIYQLFDGKLSEDRHRLFWEHSLATALATRVVAEFYELQGAPEDAFSAGILHDVGALVLDVLMETQPGFLKLTQPDAPLSWEAAARVGPFMRYPYPASRTLPEEQAAYGLTHTHLGAALGQKWKLPVALHDVLQCHHTPQEAANAPELTYWVAFANELAEWWRHPLRAQHPSDALAYFSPDVVSYFEMTEPRTQAMLGRLQEQYEEAGSWLSLF
jgi:HD-like signal output (HDOD) protein